MEEQHQDLMGWLQKNYFNDRSVEEISSVTLSDPKKFERALQLIYDAEYSDNYADVNVFKETYEQKYGNPFMPDVSQDETVVDTPTGDVNELYKYSWSADNKDEAKLATGEYAVNLDVESMKAAKRQQQDEAYKELVKKKEDGEPLEDEPGAEGQLTYTQKRNQRRTPMEKMLWNSKGQPTDQATMAQYLDDVASISSNYTTLMDATASLDRRIEQEFGKDALGQLSAKMEEYKALNEKITGQVNKNVKPDDNEVKTLNTLYQEIQNMQNHNLIQTRGEFVGLINKNIEKAKGLLEQDKYQLVDELIAMSEDIGKYDETQQEELKGWKKFDYFADGVILKSVAKLPKTVGAIMDIIETKTTGDDEYGKWDQVEDWMGDIASDADMVFPTPSAWARPMFTDVVKWNGYEVDVKGVPGGEKTIQSVRDKDGRIVDLEISKADRERIVNAKSNTQFNPQGLVYQTSGVITDVLFQIGATKLATGLTSAALSPITAEVGGAMTMARMGGTPMVGGQTLSAAHGQIASSIGLTSSVAGMMTGDLYEQGLEMFDGDKKKAGNYAMTTGILIGVSANLFGVEKKLATGHKGWLDDIVSFNKNMTKAGQPMTAVEMAKRGVTHVFKEGAGEMFEEAVLEEAIDRGVQYMMGVKQDGIDVNELAQTGVQSFIVGALMGGGSLPQELNDVQNIALEEALRDIKGFENGLREAINLGQIVPPVISGKTDQEAAEDYINERVTELKKIKETADVFPNVKPDARPDMIKKVRELNDIKDKADKAKAANVPGAADAYNEEAKQKGTELYEYTKENAKEGEVAPEIPVEEEATPAATTEPIVAPEPATESTSAVEPTVAPEPAVVPEPEIKVDEFFEKGEAAVAPEPKPEPTIEPKLEPEITAKTPPQATPPPVVKDYSKIDLTDDADAKKAVESVFNRFDGKPEDAPVSEIESNLGEINNPKVAEMLDKFRALPEHPSNATFEDMMKAKPDEIARRARVLERKKRGLVDQAAQWAGYDPAKAIAAQEVDQAKMDADIESVAQQFESEGLQQDADQLREQKGGQVDIDQQKNKIDRIKFQKARIKGQRPPVKRKNIAAEDVFAAGAKKRKRGAPKWDEASPDTKKVINEVTNTYNKGENTIALMGITPTEASQTTTGPVAYWNRAKANFDQVVGDLAYQDKGAQKGYVRVTEETKDKAAQDLATVAQQMEEAATILEAMANDVISPNEVKTFDKYTPNEAVELIAEEMFNEDIGRMRKEGGKASDIEEAINPFFFPPSSFLHDSGYEVTLSPDGITVQDTSTGEQNTLPISEMATKVRKANKIGWPRKTKRTRLVDLANELEPNSPMDDIAINFGAGARIKAADINRYGDPNYIKDDPSILIRFTAKDGTPIDIFAKEIADKWSVDEQKVIEQIIEFVSTQSTGEYIRDKIKGDTAAFDEAFEVLPDEEIQAMHDEGIVEAELEVIQKDAEFFMHNLSDQEVDQFNALVDEYLADDGTIDWDGLLEFLVDPDFAADMLDVGTNLYNTIKQNARKETEVSSQKDEAVIGESTEQAEGIQEVDLESQLRQADKELAMATQAYDTFKADNNISDDSLIARDPFDPGKRGDEEIDIC